MQAHTPDAAVARLIAEADSYLAGLSGPGIDEVRIRIAQVSGADIPKLRPAVAANANPVLARWLAPAVAATDRPELAGAIEGAAPHLAWTTYAYPTGQAGPAFPHAHAYASIIGDGGRVHLPGFDLGLFLIAPGIFYRDHRHAAPELYAPLTGPHRWRFRPGAPLVALPAHVPVWNPPHQPHATLAGKVPFLCLYAWTHDIHARAEMIPAPDWATIEAGL